MNTCRITGTLTNAQGLPLARARVTARPVGQGQAPNEAKNASRQSVYVATNELGRFELPLIRGLVVMLVCEEIGYHRTVTVPLDVETIDFRSLS